MTTQIPAYLDVCNCVFEFVSAGVIWLSVRQICKDKGAKGVAFAQAAFFTLESFWNLHYYSELHQTMSYIAGIGSVAGNLAWLWLAFSWFSS